MNTHAVLLAVCLAGSVGALIAPSGERRATDSIAQKKVVVDVELRVQWSGTPDPFFGTESTGEFPGIEVPLALGEALRRMRGQILTVDPSNYPLSAAAELERLFEASSALTDTPGNQEFALYGDPLPTTSGGPHWRPLNADSLAWAVGTTALKADGTRDPAAMPALFESKLPLKGGKQMSATFWIKFQLQKDGWN